MRRPPARRASSIPGQGSAGAPPGTSITVRGLFRRQPARLKFMRSAAAEGGQIATVLTHYALAYPEVRFTLRADKRTALATPGNGDLRDAAAAVYSVDVAAELLPLDAEPQGLVEVAGLIGSPAVSRANRNYISLFVNRRWIRHRALTFAVVEAYQGMLPSGRFPIAMIGVRLPLDEVDVNVHPAKAEVRFRDERAVFATVQRAVRATLSARTPVPVLDAAGPAFQAGSWQPQPAEGNGAAFSNLELRTSRLELRAAIRPGSARCWGALAPRLPVRTAAA